MTNSWPIWEYHLCNFFFETLYLCITKIWKHGSTQINSFYVYKIFSKTLLKCLDNYCEHYYTNHMYTFVYWSFVNKFILRSVFLIKRIILFVTCSQREVIIKYVPLIHLMQSHAITCNHGILMFNWMDTKIRCKDHKLVKSKSFEMT